VNYCLEITSTYISTIALICRRILECAMLVVHIDCSCGMLSRLFIDVTFTTSFDLISSSSGRCLNVITALLSILGHCSKACFKQLLSNFVKRFSKI
jgi:hypothetical protein